MSYLIFLLPIFILVMAIRDAEHKD